MLSASSVAVWRLGRPIVLAGILAACGEQNTYVPPPPPKVDVALPVKQTVTPYLHATGNTAAVNTTTLVARVSGFIQEIDYKDGDQVKEGTKLFVIEPEPYELALEQAQAAQSSADAAALQSATDYGRAAELLKKGVATQQDVDKASAQKAADEAKQKQTEVDVKQAQLNLDYTEVKAPFDGIVTARDVSMGQLVSAGTSTLATVVQLEPIHVTFNISEQDVQNDRGSEEDPRRGRPPDGRRLPAPGDARLRLAEPQRLDRDADGARGVREFRPPVAARLFRARARPARAAA
jgi:RND family efflux transporter MFP subunit